MVLARMICRRFIHNFWGNFMEQSMPPQTKMGTEFLLSPLDRIEYGALPDLTST